MKKEEDKERNERVYDVKILFIITTTYRGNILTQHHHFFNAFYVKRFLKLRTTFNRKNPIT